MYYFTLANCFVYLLVDIFLQLLAISGYFLERQVILDIFGPNYYILLQMFSEELDKCKMLYDEHVKQVQYKGTFTSL